VLDEARSSDYVIWAVALLLYVWDSASLLAPRDLLLVESGRRRLAVRMSESPFTIAGRVLAFSPLLLPWRGAFVAPWGRPWVDAPALAATLQAVQQGRAALLAVRVLATWAFALLFVGAPLLTLLMGPNTAVLYTAMGLYPTVLVAIGCLWWQRGRLGLARARTVWLSFDVLLCPAFLPNLVRKITVPQRIEIDGVQVLFATAPSEIDERFLARLEGRAENPIDDEGRDEPEREQLSSYLATVKAAQ
jgi:hypothetical protein